MSGSVFDDIVSISPLEIARQEGDTLHVPLEAVDGEPYEGVRIFEDGVVWEDERASLALTLETTAPVRRAVLSVNDHNELWMQCEWLTPMSYGGQKTYRYAFEVERDNHASDYRYPFAFTCGFARVQVRVIFKDGSEALYESRDIVSLDEPREGGTGQSGERAEESNVRDMYKALLRVESNQATEWMFSTYTATAEGGLLSSDDDTDWQHEALARLLASASEALDLVYDGLEDEADEFPNEVGDDLVGDGDASRRFDTPENRAVRALLSSLAEHTLEAQRCVEDALAEMDALLERLAYLLEEEGKRRMRKQSLPVVALIEAERAQEATWLMEATDLAERAAYALEDFDDFMGGAGTVGEEAFHLPPDEGLYTTSEIYRQLREAMVAWAGVSSVRSLRTDVSLHAIKPDRLFEYYALQRMLEWLYDQGFRENEAYDQPIARYRYSLAETYEKYENDARCANTFHLRRVEDGCTVDLYYQAVIYGDEREENGITLHRTERSHDGREGVWTPDYLLIVGRDGMRTTYAVDAKYSAWTSLLGSRGKLADCISKYLLRTCDGVDGAAGEALAGVWLLCGKIDAGKLQAVSPVRLGLSVQTRRQDGSQVVCGVAPLNRNAGKRKMRRLFEQWGIRPLAEMRV